MKGTAPGPGRPKGSVSEPKKVLQKEVTRLVQDKLHLVAGTAIDTLQKHMVGDDPSASVRASQIILDKLLANARHAGTFVSIPELADVALPIAERAKAINAALATGAVSVETHALLLRSLESEAKTDDVFRVHQLLGLLRQGIAFDAAVAAIERDPSDETPLVIDVTPHEHEDA